MDLEIEFKQEFIEKYSEEDFDEVRNLIEYGLENYKKCICEEGLWEISTQIEKHDSLQYTYYITLINKNNEEEITLEYENGINNGTVLRDYSFEGDRLIPSYRKVDVLKEVKIISRTGFKPPEDMTISEYKRLPLILLDIYKKRNYDNYVTGNNIGVKQYKQDFTDDLRERGLKWKCIYEEIECDVNLI